MDSAPVPKLTATQPEVADKSEGEQGPLVPFQQFLAETWSAQPITEDWTAAPTAQATEQVGTATEWSEAVLPHAAKQNRRQG